MNEFEQEVLKRLDAIEENIRLLQQSVEHFIEKELEDDSDLFMGGDY